VTSREPVDVARLVKDWAKTDLAARFPELSVRLWLPSDWTTGSGPVLLVEDDGDPLAVWPAATSPTIRFTTYTSGRNRTYIQALFGRVHEARIPGVAAVLPGTGILEGRDEATGGDLASFTVLTRVRTAVPQ
jgi:hypothetical protein